MNHHYLLHHWEVHAFRDGSKTLMIRPADRRRPEVGDVILGLEVWQCSIGDRFQMRYLLDPDEPQPVSPEQKRTVVRAMFDSDRYLGEALPAVLLPDPFVRIRRTIVSISTHEASYIDDKWLDADGYRQVGDFPPRMTRYRQMWNDRFASAGFKMPSKAPVFVMFLKPA